MFEEKEPFKFNFSSDVDIPENASNVERQSTPTMPAEELLFSTQVSRTFSSSHLVLFVPGSMY